MACMVLVWSMALANVISMPQLNFLILAETCFQWSQSRPLEVVGVLVAEVG